MPVCVYVSTQVCICGRACMCVVQRWAPSTFPWSLSLFFFWDRVFFFFLKLSRLDAWQASTILLSPSPQFWEYRDKVLCLAFYVGAGDQAQLPWLCGRPFTHRAVSPPLLFLKDLAVTAPRSTSSQCAHSGSLLRHSSLFGVSWQLWWKTSTCQCLLL